MNRSNNRVNNRSNLLEESVCLNFVKKLFLAIFGLTIKIVANIKNSFSTFKNPQFIGFIVISMVLTNLLLVYIFEFSVKKEWIMFRFLIILVFLPWIFCKENFRNIAKNSVFLKHFFKK